MTVLNRIGPKIDKETHHSDQQENFHFCISEPALSGIVCLQLRIFEISETRGLPINES